MARNKRFTVRLIVFQLFSYCRLASTEQDSWLFLIFPKYIQNRYENYRFTCPVLCNAKVQLPLPIKTNLTPKRCLLKTFMFFMNMHLFIFVIIQFFSLGYMEIRGNFISAICKSCKLTSNPMLSTNPLHCNILFSTFSQLQADLQQKRICCLQIYIYIFTLTFFNCH